MPTAVRRLARGGYGDFAGHIILISWPAIIWRIAAITKQKIVTVRPWQACHCARSSV